MSSHQQMVKEITKVLQPVEIQALTGQVLQQILRIQHIVLLQLLQWLQFNLVKVQFMKIKNNT